MNEQNHPPIDSPAGASGKAAYKFMAAKKEPMPISEPEETDTDSSSIDIGNKPKDAIRRKRSNTAVSYIETFLCRYELSSRQGLHLEKETIATIKSIIHSIGDERLTVSRFVENILKHHFELYKDEVNRLYDEKLCRPID